MQIIDDGILIAKADVSLGHYRVPELNPENFLAAIKELKDYVNTKDTSVNKKNFKDVFIHMAAEVH